MSARKLSLRGGTSLKRRRGRKILMRAEDDLPLSMLAVLTKKQPKSKKNSTPRKRAVKTRTVANTTTPEVLNLDESSDAVEVFKTVHSQTAYFMQSGSFISSDEDEAEMIKAKTHKKTSPNLFFISDDSDDDCKPIKPPSNLSNFDYPTASTSGGTSKNNSGDNKLESHLDEDIMNIVNSVLDKKSDEPNPLKDLKSLEDYRKETEEMLKNADLLLNEIKAGCASEVKEKNEEKGSPKVTVGSCPVCLESLVNRPASVTVCGHIFCKECIMQTAQTLKKCPTCRKGINSKKIHPIYF